MCFILLPRVSVRWYAACTLSESSTGIESGREERTGEMFRYGFGKLRVAEGHSRP